MSLFAIFIFSYGRFRSKRPGYRDPLMRSIGLGDLDGWSMLHLLAYAGMGMYYPGCDLEVLGIGAGWEAFEFMMGKERPGWLGGFGDHPENINAQEHKRWWDGRWSDLVMNAAGFYLGAWYS